MKGLYKLLRFTPSVLYVNNLNFVLTHNLILKGGFSLADFKSFVSGNQQLRSPHRIHFWYEPDSPQVDDRSFGKSFKFDKHFSCQVRKKHVVGNNLKLKTFFHRLQKSSLVLDIFIFAIVKIWGVQVEWFGVDEEVILFHLYLVLELVAALKTESPSYSCVPEDVVFHRDNDLMVLEFLGVYMGDFPIALNGKAKGATSQKGKNKKNYWKIIHY